MLESKIKPCKKELERLIFQVDTLRDFIEKSHLEDTEIQRLRGYLLELESLALKTFY